MKTILLACAAGMSTSMLVQRMADAAASKNIETDIFAVSVDEVERKLDEKNVDAILLGPQVRYMETDFKKKYENENRPVAVINMMDYGTMNGEKVLQTALDLMD